MPYRKKGTGEGKWITQKSRYSGKGNPNYRGFNAECAWCHKPIRKSPSRLNRNEAVYCSSSCYHQSQIKHSKQPRISRNEMHGERHPRWAGARLCKECGAELLTRIERRSGYCSKRCIHKSRSKRLSGKGNPRWKGGRYVYTPCRLCGVEIYHHPQKSVTFCSRRCMAEWQSKNLSRENSPLWNGGSSYTVYPIEFNYKLRLSVRRRDNFTCQDCKRKQRGLNVHHIDGNKSNCSMENLVSLCQSCHRKRHWQMFKALKASTYEI